VQGVKSVEARMVGPYRLDIEDGSVVRVLRAGCIEAGDDEWAKCDVIADLCDAIALMKSTDIGQELIALDRALRVEKPGYQSPIALYRRVVNVVGHEEALRQAGMKGRLAW